MDQIRVGVIGCGYWGPNLIRNFMRCPLTELVALCDTDPQRLEAAGAGQTQVQLTRSLDELLTLDLDAVAIATPVGTHYSIATTCLEAGLHILLEKPLADSVECAEALVDKAERNERLLMVDHTYLFSNPVKKIKQLIDSDELGELYYIDGIRINLGLFQNDINVIWDLAPHDLSIMDYILAANVRSISAWGCAHANPPLEDVACLNPDFDGHLMANFHVNWLSPVKMRQLIFAGKRKSLVFNELNVNEPIKVFDRSVCVRANPDIQRQLQVGYRTGDVWSPHLDSQEALQTMVSHFASCILKGTPCQSDGQLGLRVVKYLEAATRSIRAQGGRVVLGNRRAAHMEKTNGYQLG